MANLLLDIGMYLIANGIVTADGVDYFRDATPDTPVDIVSAFEYPGLPTNIGDESCDRNVQIRVRNKSYEQARIKSNAIFNLLDNPDDKIVSLTAARWCIIRAKQSPYKMSVDNANNTTFVFNLVITTFRD